METGTHPSTRAVNSGSGNRALLSVSKVTVPVTYELDVWNLDTKFELSTTKPSFRFGLRATDGQTDWVQYVRWFHRGRAAYEYSRCLQLSDLKGYQTIILPRLRYSLLFGRALIAKLFDKSARWSLALTVLLMKAEYNELLFKPGFHYPSCQPELTARVDGWPVSITRQRGPCWWARVSTSRVDGPWTRVVETGL